MLSIANEDLLRFWDEARRRKNFAVADTFREEVRRRANTIREEMRRSTVSVADEDLLMSWASARSAKNFDVADTVREELRSRGVDPDTRRCNLERRHIYDLEIEAMLDEWLEAKRSHAFAKADRIRGELFRRGINPEYERPRLPGYVMSVPTPATCASKNKSDVTSVAIREDSVGTGETQRTLEPNLVQPVAQPSLSQPIEPEVPIMPVTAFISKRANHSPLTMKTIGPTPDVDEATAVRLEEWVRAKRQRDFDLADFIYSELRAKGIDADMARPSDKDIHKYFEAARSTEAFLCSLARQPAQGQRSAEQDAAASLTTASGPSTDKTAARAMEKRAIEAAVEAANERVKRQRQNAAPESTQLLPAAACQWTRSQ